MYQHVCILLLSLLVSQSISAAPVSGQGTWESTLQARDLDDDISTVEAYYDTALNITWLADANYAQTSGYDADGLMTWGEANTWASGLDFNGITGWRLPSVTDTGTAGCDFAYSGTDCGYNVDVATGEMAHMYYQTLGNLAHYDTSGNVQGYILSNTANFANAQLFFTGLTLIMTL